MKVLKYLTETRRIVFKKVLVYGWLYILQEKRWYGWKRITSQYPHIMKNYSFEELVHQLEYQEENHDRNEKLIVETSINKWFSK